MVCPGRGQSVHASALTVCEIFLWFKDLVLRLNVNESFKHLCLIAHVIHEYFSYIVL